MGEPSEALAVTDRTRHRRKVDRGSHERALVHAILDAGFVAHVGFAGPDGPVVIPTAYGRDGDVVLLHGSPASRLMRTLAGGIPVCVTVTLVDGLVLARSTTHHSLNFRSVVLFGTATVVDGLDQRARALGAFVDHVLPGRSGEARPPTEKELRGTMVLALPIDEASAKVRTGPPVDDEEDLALPVWAGVVPLTPVAGAPEPDDHVPAGLPLPPSLVARGR